MITSCGGVCLFGFLCSCFFAVVPTNFTLPFLTIEGKSLKIRIDFRNSGIIVIIILLLLQCINLDEIYRGIIGNSILEPYSILLLFLSLAYISISLDQTGFFATIAYYFAKKIGNSGKKFFIFVFLLSSILTIFTSNDIVIMTLTPVICFISNQSGVDVTSYLIVQFFCANIWSAGFYFGNPTNVIVAQSVNMNFIQYSFVNLLPTIISGIVAIILISFFTKNKIPEQINVVFPDLPPLNRFQAGLGVFLLCCSTCCIIIFTFYPKLPIFLAALPFAIIAFVKDLLYDAKRKISFQQKQPDDQFIELDVITQETDDENITVEENSNSSDDLVVFHWNTSKILSRMPWDVIPFTLGMFILVESLDSNGLITIIAKFFVIVIGNNVVVAIFFVGISSTLACNIMNNQPMTILFVRIILNDYFVSNTSNEVISGCLFSMALGSNFGANLTLIGALAGILWCNILQQYEVEAINYTRFASYGFRVMPFVVLSSLIVLAAEISIKFL